ncbi:CCHC-type zinc finger nucleic acid binding protein-like [Palaemon carinicauda]|uniref:CCHC-type zinc finger nucleic acid binding protein-like n=1 Tax=Palaemon carinicauda TaxID=392227 RepID=UPI0035B623EF
MKVMKEFGNVSDIPLNSRGKDDKVIECWTCGDQGHVSYQCKNGGFSRDNIVQDQGEGHQYKGRLGKNRTQNKHVLENQFTGTCWSCGEDGHPFYKCNLYSSKNRGLNNARGDKVVREMSLQAGDNAQENL